MSTDTATATVPAPKPLGRLAGVGAIIFAANAAMLVLQLVAGKLLAPFIGSSLETWTGVIGVFLVGIALGNAYGGKLADRYPTPRTLTALLAAGAVAALWMLVFPSLLGFTGLHKLLPLGPRIPILAALLCLPAGFVLSLLTPLAIKLGLPDVAHTGRVAGLIFALSTLGCLLGNYATGFYLIPSFTINALVLVSAGVLFALAGVSTLMGRVEEPTPPAPLPAGRGEISNREADTSLLPVDPSSSPSLQGGGRGVGFLDIRRAHQVVFLASFCGMTLELTASRVLAQAVGVSLFTWTGVIGVMLAGTALGNFAGGLLADRAARRNPRAALAATLILAGGATVLVFVTMALVTRYGSFESWDLITQVIGITFSLFFLPMFALGLVSPQVIRLSVTDVAHAGRVAGRVYAWSTAGAIAGTFAAGYVLLSSLGMYHALLAVALALTLSSLLVENIWRDSRQAARGVAGPPAGSGMLLYFFAIVLGGVTGGFILLSRKGEPNVVAQVESNYYVIKVVHTPQAGRESALSLNLDRLLHSVVDPEDPGYLHYTHEHIQMEMLRLARAGSPRPRALVIGGGGYTFPRLAAETLPEAQVDVVEIDPKVTQVARDHMGLKDYPNLRAVHMDGRQFVAERAAPGSYDLVIQDAVNDLSVPGHLMTREYNDAVKAALKPGGAYLLTIIDAAGDGKLWKAAMATLRQTFPADNVVMLSDGPVAPRGTAAGDSWDATRHVMVIYASEKPFSQEALQAALPGGVRTNAVPAERLKPFTDREPGLVLTDQFCPTDNLMAEVFRNRNK